MVHLVVRKWLNLLSLYKAVPFMKENGKVKSEKDTESKNGLMDQNTRVNGLMTRLTDLVDCFMQMEIFMKENGRMIRQMGKALILMLMGQDIKEIGKMISNTALV